MHTIPSAEPENVLFSLRHIRGFYHTMLDKASSADPKGHMGVNFIENSERNEILEVVKREKDRYNVQ